MTTNASGYQEYRVSGDRVVARLRDLVREGNVRRLFLKRDNGDTIMEIPLSSGVALTAVGAVFSPALIAAGAVAAMFASVTIGVERPVATEQSAGDTVSDPGPRT